MRPEEEEEEEEQKDTKKGFFVFGEEGVRSQKAEACSTHSILLDYYIQSIKYIQEKKSNHSIPSINKKNSIGIVGF